MSFHRRKWSSFIFSPKGKVQSLSLKKKKLKIIKAGVVSVFLSLVSTVKSPYFFCLCTTAFIQMELRVFPAPSGIILYMVKTWIQSFHWFYTVCMHDRLLICYQECAWPQYLFFNCHSVSLCASSSLLLVWLDNTSGMQLPNWFVESFPERCKEFLYYFCTKIVEILLHIEIQRAWCRFLPISKLPKKCHTVGILKAP